MPKPSGLSPFVRRCVEDAGNITQSFGMGRVLGQIYAYLYFSASPRCLADMQEALGISKGSASTGVRQLEQWAAVRKIWVKGDRKDYYEANDWFGQILKNAVVDTIGKKLSAYTFLLNDAVLDPADSPSSDGEGAFVEDRIRHLRKFHARAQKFWNSSIIRMLLK